MPVNIKMCVYCIYNNPNQTNPECINKHTTNNKSKMRLLAVAVAEKETKTKTVRSSKSKRRTERGELEKKGWNS
jgi:hypothetical protein